MRRFSLSDSLKYVLWILVIMSLVLACERVPNPDFSFLPRENVEAGDTIWFTNHSKGNYQFAWDFGDGTLSYLEEPKHVYEVPGIYEARLSASNESDEGAVSHTIFVNDPTVLGFIISDSTGTRMLKDATVWVYASADERDRLALPLYTGLSNTNGIADFHNLEPMIYHIWIYKEEASGYWAYKGFTSPLKQNRVNRFTVPCFWFDQP